ncbi:MAG: D-alanyl-D-alanine dipeptidase [Acetobacteraceae bacterium]|nr:D-alanyl-D-alanine dipeptidase [Acetobacteraceae bacterium]
MLVALDANDLLTLDLRYATPDNVTGRPIYTRPIALLLQDASQRLLAAAARARALGLRLRVFDAFRPVEAQWALWHAIEDKNFVGDPRGGAVHPRGAAVDLTLEDAGSGQPLEMGTGFDSMTARSAHASTDIPADALRNRALLLGVMTAAGWEHHPLEWWHYQLAGAHRFPAFCASAVPGGPM